MRWYVYELCDPASEQPFYVGKGCGRRMYAHLGPGAANHVKEVVDAIKARGEVPIVRAIAYFYDEIDALNFESARIRESTGLVNRVLNGPIPKTVSLYDVLWRVGAGKISKVSAEMALSRFQAQVVRMKEEWAREIYQQLIDVGFTGAQRLK
jgi:hypothetical protein